MKDFIEKSFWGTLWFRLISQFVLVTVVFIPTSMIERVSKMAVISLIGLGSILYTVLVTKIN